MNELRIPILVIYAACGLATFTDVRRFRISNTLTFPLVISGLIYHAMTEGWPGLGRGFAGAAFGLAVLIVPYAMGGMGAGDVKFLAAVGAWLGIPMTYEILIASAFAGGVFAVILIIINGRFRETAINLRRLFSPLDGRRLAPVQEIAHCPDRRNHLVPFAAMVAVGLVATVSRM